MNRGRRKLLVVASAVFLFAAAIVVIYVIEVLVGIEVFVCGFLIFVLCCTVSLFFCVDLVKKTRSGRKNS